MTTIKLRPKQLNAINNVQAQKQQLNALLQEANHKEVQLLELFLEEKAIQGEISNIKLEGDSLSFDVSEKPAGKEKEESIPVDKSK
jgi:hypothetical protein